jgi:hypothetical protein
MRVGPLLKQRGAQTSLQRPGLGCRRQHALPRLEIQRLGGECAGAGLRGDDGRGREGGADAAGDGAEDADSLGLGGHKVEILRPPPQHSVAVVAVVVGGSGGTLVRGRGGVLHTRLAATHRLCHAPFARQAES